MKSGQTKLAVLLLLVFIPLAVAVLGNYSQSNSTTSLAGTTSIQTSLETTTVPETTTIGQSAATQMPGNITETTVNTTAPESTTTLNQTSAIHITTTIIKNTTTSAPANASENAAPTVPPETSTSAPADTENTTSTTIENTTTTAQENQTTSTALNDTEPLTTSIPENAAPTVPPETSTIFQQLPPVDDANLPENSLEVSVSTPSKITRGGAFTAAAIVKAKADVYNVNIEWQLPPGFEIVGGTQNYGCGSMKSGDACSASIKISSSASSDVGLKSIGVAVRYE